jgi:Helitron helicase-like domain at N-terminus
MQRLYQDSMAIVRHFGRPSLFITFTTNPDWEEITRELLTDEYGVCTQCWGDRPDLVSRVFNLKLKEMLQELRRDNIFGRHVASVYTVEFQKRGLPHAHILLFLDGKSQFDTPEKVDNVISAEIPDPVADFELYNIITKFMIHGPCDSNKEASCMKDYGTGFSCSKNFPRSYMEETVMDQNSYPSYRRRVNRFSATVRDPLNRRETVTVGNKWVVPYNPYLSKKYKAHINVEICGTIRAIRYIHKYIYKGSDRATIELDASVDEINGRCDCGKSSIGYPHWPPSTVNEAFDQLNYLHNEHNTHRRHLAQRW